MVGGRSGPAIIHVHPSLRCNLTCAHCYSQSSPRLRNELDVEALLETLAALRRAGYEALSLSGGEPFLYRSLARLVNGAHDLGLSVHVITNGVARPPRQLPISSRTFDLIAVSLDGLKRRHDSIRRRDGSFEDALATLRKLRDGGCRVAVVSCITRGSLPEVPDLFELCLREGVHLLALRPLVDVGRAQNLLTSGEDATLSPSDLLRLKLIAEILDSRDGTRVRADVSFAGDVRRSSIKRYPFLREVDSEPFENIDPIVIKEDGVIVPYVYGISERYALGNVKLSPESLNESLRSRSTAVAGLIADALATLPGDDSTCVDWFQHVLHRSHANSWPVSIFPCSD